MDSPKPQKLYAVHQQPQAQPGYPQAAPEQYPPTPQQHSGAAYSSPMPMPQQAGPGCPPGLEYLTMIDQLLVHQKVELLEALIGFETNNKYSVCNSMGQNVYFAAEDTDFCTRICCGVIRPFDLKIIDNSGREVIHLNRPLRCQSWCFPCCLQELEVTSPPGIVIGYVIQEWTVCYPEFSIQNAFRETVLRIQGPFCPISCGGDVDFQVFNTSGQVVGKISKHWSGLVKELLTDADNFGITFPMDLDVKMKAVLLGACFLIDFMFFETSGN